MWTSAEVKANEMSSGESCFLLGLWDFTENERENELRHLIALVTEYLKQTTKSCTCLLRNGLCRKCCELNEKGPWMAQKRKCVGPIYFTGSVTVISLYYVNYKKTSFGMCTDHTSSETNIQYCSLSTTVRNSNLSYYYVITCYVY
jgi:hypothetical protein